MSPEDHDPVIASYDVHIALPPPPPPSDNAKPNPEGDEPPQSEQPQKPAPKYYVLQYPAHRPNSKPYSSARLQRPSSFRIKPSTGIFEVDVPILTSDNYNLPQGQLFGNHLHESHVANPYTGHGLSGGFAQNSTAPIINLENGDRDHDFALRTQTLGGKLATQTERDPVYMLATLNRDSKAIHLRHVDAVVQLRPQLHHIDAADEARRRAEVAVKVKPEQPTVDGKAKLETKAIDMKMKDATKDDPKERNLNLNARLLREIQNEKWTKYAWIEEGQDAYKQSLASQVTDEALQTKLKSAMDNDEWLNRMSSPGIELRTRLKGRDRERARRKRQERQRAAKAAGDAANKEDVDISDIESSEEEEPAQRPTSPEVRIKQEAGGAAASSATPTASGSSASGPKRRGRPPKNKQMEAASLDQ